MMPLPAGLWGIGPEKSDTPATTPIELALAQIELALAQAFLKPINGDALFGKQLGQAVGGIPQ